VVDVEKGGKRLDVGFRSLGLAVEDGCGGDFGTADFLADGFEGEVLFLFGFEEGW